MNVEKNLENVEKEEFPSGEASESFKRVIGMLNKERKVPYYEKILRKIPPFSTLYAQCDALAFYVKQLSTFAYNASLLISHQQTQMNELAEAILAYVGSEKKETFEPKKTTTKFDKPN